MLHNLLTNVPTKYTFIPKVKPQTPNFTLVTKLIEYKPPTKDFTLVYKQIEYKPSKADQLKRPRGWKSDIIRDLLGKTGFTIDRPTLAKMINSDERNTHVLISKISERPTWTTKINYDRKTRIYTT